MDSIHYNECVYDKITARDNVFMIEAFRRIKSSCSFTDCTRFVDLTFDSRAWRRFLQPRDICRYRCAIVARARVMRINTNDINNTTSEEKFSQYELEIYCLPS